MHGLYPVLKPLLFSLNPETAHQLTLKSLDLAKATGLIRAPKFDEPAAVEIMGLSFPSVVGLAAGLDKNGEHIDALAALGFGFIEIGTVTPRPQPGNPRPRMFRLPEAEAIINRMGFNNQGIDYLLEQVKKSRFKGILGINIGKNADTPMANAVDDYLLGLEKAYPFASYITVNISSPNTANLRHLQDKDQLGGLLSALKDKQSALHQQHGFYVPLVLKIAPDMDAEAIKVVADTLLDYDIDAVIATNTTIDKSAVAHMEHGQEQGGLSGRPLTAHATEVVKQLYQHLGEEIPIIAAGGIMSADDAQAKLDAGAKLVQVYSGLIYRGPQLILDIAQACHPKKADAQA